MKLLPLLVLLAFLLHLAPTPAPSAENVWEKIAFEGTHVIDLAVDPARASTVYAVTPDGLMRSDDRGRNWSPRTAGLPQGKPPSSLAVNPRKSREMYLGYDGLGVFKSVDGGESWRPANDGLPNMSVRCLVISARDPNLVYAGVMGGVAITTSAGKHWHMTSGFPQRANVNAIAIDPKDPQRLYAGSGGSGVYVSGNGGVSWKDSNAGLSSLTIFAMQVNGDGAVLAGAYHPASPADVYVGTASGGVFRSLDKGATWQGTSLFNTTIFSFAAHPQHAGVVYAGAWGGAYRSMDGGATWDDINEGLDNAFLHKVLALPLTPPILLGGTTYGLLSYVDTSPAPAQLAGESRPVATYAILAAVLCAIAAGLLLLRRRRRSTPSDKPRTVW
ncbi:MAG: hypothetical protein LBR22_04320 [Desulfovibrio sp.]|jgi:photosystem II stability/assembly factor-like uncharacterized protein|nr:hypothetical protein [Desulfovibrio sp.]